MSSAGPYSYFNYYQAINEPIVKDIVKSYIDHEAIFTRFPIETVRSLKRKSKRIIGNLPTPTPMDIGEEPPVPFVQDYEDYEEAPYLLRDNFDLDELFMMDENYVQGEPLERQIESYIEGRTFYINNCFINNSHTDGPIRERKMIVGIKYRLATTQFGNSPTASVQSTANLSDAQFSVSNAIKVERDLERLFDQMGNHNGNGMVVMGNPQLLRQLNAVVKSAGYSGGFKTTADAFDREVIKFKGAEIVSVGYQAPAANGAQNTPVIDSAQDLNGWSPGDSQYQGNANATTLYVVWGGRNKFSTWQMTDPMLRKVMPISGTRKNRVMFDQTLGLWNPDIRALGRIYGIVVNGPAGD